MSIRNYSLIFGFIVAVAFHYGSAKSINTHIISGELASPGQFPYIVSLVRSKADRLSHACGGLIISKDWILTAAHCSRAISTTGSLILVGATNRTTDGELVTFDRSIDHPAFNYNNLSSDLALHHLTTSLNFSETVQPIQLKKDFVEGGLRILTMGWGRTKWGSSDLPIELRFLYLNSYTNEECRQRLPNSMRILVTNTTLCTGVDPGFDVCSGDSGGPAILDNQLVGITSWTYPPCGRGGPNGFTRISTDLEWIATHSGVTAV